MRQKKNNVTTDLSNCSVSFKFGQHFLLHGHLQEIKNTQIHLFKKEKEITVFESCSILNEESICKVFSKLNSNIDKSLDTVINYYSTIIVPHICVSESEGWAHRRNSASSV